MIKRFLTIVLTLCTVVCVAADIECVGVATQVVDGKDTTFVFKDEIALRSTIGAVDWYTADGVVYASNVEDIYPDEGLESEGPDFELDEGEEQAEAKAEAEGADPFGVVSEGDPFNQ